MHRSSSFSHPYSGSRYSHGTSSAFSANANPNEDWTKISDLAERRRIQNRIAQRNYRKKLKRRLEDLERRAASSSASPEQSPAQPARTKSETAKSQSRSQNSSSRSKQAPPSSWSAPQAGILSSEVYTPSQDERGTMFAHQSTRQLSTSPPPPLFYSSYYPYHDSYDHQAYPSPPPLPQQLPSYHSLPSAQYGDLSVPTQYLETLPSPLHPLPSSAPAAKRRNAFGEEDMLNPFSMSYASMAGIDLSTATAPHEDTHLQTPPLADSYAYDDSGSASPAGSLSAYPVTPEPVSLSPHISFM